MDPQLQEVSMVLNRALLLVQRLRFAEDEHVERARRGLQSAVQSAQMAVGVVQLHLTIGERDKR
jgi:hypothetical protein